MKYLRYTSENLDLQYFTSFVDDHQQIYNELFLSLFIDKPKHKRSNVTFGDIGLSYNIEFKKGEVHRKAIGWTPTLLNIKEKLEKLSENTYNICVVQYYPTEKVGIKPHKDKEMVKGTTICGISLGHTRTLRMSFRDTNLDIPLQSGSLYMFNPPTNDYWTHSIISTNDDTSSVTDGRISLTYRNYKPL